MQSEESRYERNGELEQEAYDLAGSDAGFEGDWSGTGGRVSAEPADLTPEYVDVMDLGV